jgi:hypothetical protein
MAKKKHKSSDPCPVADYLYPTIEQASAAAQSMVAYLEGTSTDIPCMVRCSYVVIGYGASLATGNSRTNANDDTPLSTDVLKGYLKSMYEGGIDKEAIGRLPWGQIFVTIISIILPFLGL